MNKYRIVFATHSAWDRDNARRPDKIVEAKYPQHDEPWLMFKDDNNKLVFQVKETSVDSIEVVDTDTEA